MGKEQKEKETIRRPHSSSASGRLFVSRGKLLLLYYMARSTGNGSSSNDGTSGSYVRGSSAKTYTMDDDDVVSSSQC